MKSAWRKHKYFFAALFVLTFASHLAAEEVFDVVTQGIISGLAASPRADRLVLAVGRGGSDVTVYAFERVDGNWTERLRSDGFAGRNGISPAKVEGDGRTPPGVYEFGMAFGAAADPGSLKPYTRLSPGDLWIDDPESVHYNRRVRADFAGKDWKSAEDLFAETAAYRYAIAIGYNTAPIVKGAGSAIFLHCSKGRPTAGCVAVPEDAMKELLKFIDDGTLIVIAASIEELLTF
ncbi:MAG: L,D-transpeptidase family protein [Synergistaceae bacterium]|nr:L,D-transpeptidase family protein [Synergistaceae bacterium]